MYVCVICSMCMSVLISQLITASPPHFGIHWFVLYICVGFCFADEFICIISRFHIQAVLHVFFSF